MKHRRVFALGALVGVAGWAACSSYGENETTTPRVEDASSDATTNDAASDASSEATSFDADRDAFIIQDGGSKIDAAGCDANAVCDCDKDGFHHQGTLVDGGVCDASAAQKNVDCDDYDTRYRPDQGFLDSPGEPPRNGDWNCNGAIEKLTMPNLKCNSYLSSTTDCAKLQGFRDDPDCGVESPTYVFCKEGSFNCEEAASQKASQACR